MDQIRQAFTKAQIENIFASYYSGILKDKISKIYFTTDLVFHVNVKNRPHLTKVFFSLLITRQINKIEIVTNYSVRSTHEYA